MPEFSGLDVIKWLNEEGILESNNVVIFTASSDPIMLDKIKIVVLRKYSKNHFH